MHCANAVLGVAVNSQNNEQSLLHYKLECSRHMSLISSSLRLELSFTTDWTPETVLPTFGPVELLCTARPIKYNFIVNFIGLGVRVMTVAKSTIVLCEYAVSQILKLVIFLIT